MDAATPQGTGLSVWCPVCTCTVGESGQFIWHAAGHTTQFFSPGQHVMTDLAMHIVHTSAIYTGLPVKGYKLKQVALNSLQASGAIPLWIAGYNEKNLNVWLLEKHHFFFYIHSKIRTFTHGVASQMSWMISFVHVAAGWLAAGATQQCTRIPMRKWSPWASHGHGLGHPFLLTSNSATAQIHLLGKDSRGYMSNTSKHWKSSQDI